MNVHVYHVYGLYSCMMHWLYRYRYSYILIMCTVIWLTSISKSCGFLFVFSFMKFVAFYDQSTKKATAFSNPFGVGNSSKNGGEFSKVIFPKMPKTFTRWWFQIFFIFTPIWGRFPIWLIFFKGVETTNQFRFLGIVGHNIPITVRHGFIQWWGHEVFWDVNCQVDWTVSMILCLIFLRSPNMFFYF